jgi:hypothetical protein
MNLRMDCAAVWQCAAVRAAVCGSAHGGSMRAAVRLVVYGTARGSDAVCGCLAVRQCAAVCGSVRDYLCVTVRARGSVRQCGALCVWQCLAVSTVVCTQCAQCVQQCAAVRLVVCGSAWQCVAVPAHSTVSVWQCALRIYTQSRSKHIFPYKGSENEPDVARILIVTDQKELLIQIKVI